MYNLTVEDIDDFISSLEPSEIVDDGTSSGCLGALVLERKYGEKFFIPLGNVVFHRWGYRDDVKITKDVQDVLDDTDCFTVLYTTKLWGRVCPITKEEWVEHVKERGKLYV